MAFAHLRRESERKDAIIMSQANAAQARTIRALEAPQEAEEVAEMVEEAPKASDGAPARYLRPADGRTAPPLVAQGVWLMRALCRSSRGPWSPCLA